MKVRGDKLVDVKGTAKILEDSPKRILLEICGTEVELTPNLFHLFPKDKSREEKIKDFAEKNLTSLQKMTTH